MGKLSPEILDKIQEAADKVAFGEITIVLADHMSTIDLIVNERTRFEKITPPRPGEICVKRDFRRG